MTGRTIAAVLGVLSCTAAAAAAADDNDHVVINVVNGYVYVSLGTRDGASEGDRLELLEGDVAVGVLALDLCGEVICRAPLAKGVEGHVARGMHVRVVKSKVTPRPVAEPKATQPAPPPKVDEPPPGPAVLPYREPIPRGYVARYERKSGLVSLGWVGFSVTYGITALVGLAGNEEESTLLLLPVIGPLIYVAAASNVGQDESGPYVISTILQGASVLSLLAGYYGSRKLVRSDVAVMPVVTRELSYLGVIARF
jgi:hypothetical protein